MSYDFEKISAIANRRFTKRLTFCGLLLITSFAELALLVLFGDVFPVFVGCVISWIAIGIICAKKIKSTKCGKPVSAIGALSRFRVDLKGVRKPLVGGVGLVRRKYDHDFIDLKCAAIFISDPRKKKPVKIYLKALDNFQVNYYEAAAKERADVTHILAARFPVITAPEGNNKLLCPLCGALSSDESTQCPGCGEEIYLV